MEQIVTLLIDDPQASSKEIATRLRDQGRDIEVASVRWYSDTDSPHGAADCR